MAKPKNLEQLRAEKEQVETQLAQEQHKLERLENRKKYLEKGERQKRTRQMEWVQRCNNIHNRAEEIVLHEMIYS